MLTRERVMGVIGVAGLFTGVVFLMFFVMQGGEVTSSSFDFSTTTPVRATSVFKTGTATMFWIGEPSDESNAFIPNHMSYWDEQWLDHFGGIDDPQHRCSFKPCGFTPKENSFYVALPYGEFHTQTGAMKESAHMIPWFIPGANSVGSLLKNHWVHVVHGGVSCYGQWEDVGPNGEDDFAYVFGSAEKPMNTFGASAGIDLSPALFDCLGMTDNANVSWRFVSGEEIPPGPWKEVVTFSGMTWGASE